MRNSVSLLHSFTRNGVSGTSPFPSGRYTKYEARKLPEKVKIRYFLHPLYQKEVRVVDKRNYIDEQYYLIEFFDNVIVYLPLWMTDAEYCNSCKISEEPLCSLKALHELSLFFIER